MLFSVSGKFRIFLLTNDVADLLSISGDSEDQGKAYTESGSGTVTLVPDPHYGHK